MPCSLCPTIPCTCAKKKACCTSCAHGKTCESEKQLSYVKKITNTKNIKQKFGGKGRIVNNSVCLSCSSNQRYVHRPFARNKSVTITRDRTRQYDKNKYLIKSKAI